MDTKRIEALRAEMQGKYRMESVSVGTLSYLLDALLAPAASEPAQEPEPCVFGQESDCSCSKHRCPKCSGPGSSRTLPCVDCAQEPERCELCGRSADPSPGERVCTASCLRCERPLPVAPAPAPLKVEPVGRCGSRYDSVMYGRVLCDRDGGHDGMHAGAHNAVVWIDAGAVGAPAPSPKKCERCGEPMALNSHGYWFCPCVYKPEVAPAPASLTVGDRVVWGRGTWKVIDPGPFAYVRLGEHEHFLPLADLRRVEEEKP